MINYISKSQKEINDCYSEILKSYTILEKKNGSNNFIKLLLHELAFFFFTHIAIKNIKKKNKLLVKPTFLKRDKKNIFLNYQNSYKRKIISFIFNFLPLKKKALINNFVPLSKKDLFKLVFFLILKGYRPIFECDTFFVIKDLDNQKNSLFNLVKKLNKKFNIKVNLDIVFKQINFFIKNNFSKKKLQIYDLYISGTPGNIYNRITCHNAMINKKKIIFFSHNKECGLVNSPDHQIDDYSNCTDMIGFGNGGKKNKKSFFHPVGKIKMNYYSSNNFKKFEPKVENINYEKFINSNNGIYISGKVQHLSCIGVRVFNPIDYIDWQKKLLSEFSHIKIKTHPKQKVEIKYKNTIIYSKINDLLRNSDFFILDNADSSSFAEIAVSSKPIIFFDLGYIKYDKKQIELLKRRTYYFKIDLKKISFKGLENIFLNKKNNNLSKKYIFDQSSSSQLNCAIHIINKLNNVSK